jgi:hypothetical protein
MSRRSASGVYTVSARHRLQPETGSQVDLHAAYLDEESLDK